MSALTAATGPKTAREQSSSWMNDSSTRPPESAGLSRQCPVRGAASSTERFGDLPMRSKLPVTGVPMAPSATRRRTVRKVPKKRIVWPMASFTPARSQASIMRRQDPRSRAMGFSQSTCRPASAARVTSSGWLGVGVPMTTTSTSESSRSSRRVTARAPASSARVRAASGSRSKVTARSQSGCSPTALIQARAMLPQPISPMRCLICVIPS